MISYRRPAPTRAGLAALGAALALTAAACGAGSTTGSANDTASSGPAVTISSDPLVDKLSTEVDAAGAMTHLQQLQKIADAHGGNRSAGTAGYDASVDYVAGVLRDAGFEVTTPTFTPSRDDDDDDDDAAPVGAQRNVIAQTRTGDTGNVVMIGAHVDSVPEGPGIVDDGSGVATLLEIATRLGPDPAVRNSVRFAFFGDEESGAEGSSGYVNGLSSADRKAIKMYFNVDMVASPNGGYFVQGGKGDDEDSAGPPGSATIGKVFAEQLTKAGVTPETIEFVGDDESPFIEAGIPVGGAENGDAENKTAAQATAWGGQAGKPYDSCYHSACDKLDNVNQELLAHYMRAIAGTVGHFATSTDALR